MSLFAVYPRVIDTMILSHFFSWPMCAIASNLTPLICLPSLALEVIYSTLLDIPPKSWHAPLSNDRQMVSVKSCYYFMQPLKFSTYQDTHFWALVKLTVRHIEGLLAV